MILIPQVTVETKRCIVCLETGDVTMPRIAFFRFTQGMAVQEAWPEGSAEEREQLINGTHPECFALLFGSEPEEDDE
jgi:hypothetical protein